MAKSAIAKGRRVIIICHREELIEQISNTLYQFDIDHGFIASAYGSIPFHKVQVASVFTLARRLSKIPAPDLLIQDEAHHCTKASTWGKVFAFWPNAVRIGVTATPCRLSGEALGDLFDCLITGAPVRELIASGVLSDYRMFAPTHAASSQYLREAGVKTRAGDYARDALSDFMDRPTITGDAVATYSQYAKGKRAAVFCVSVVHAHHTAEAFSKAGFAASALDGSMDRITRHQHVRDFRKGTLQVLTSCDLISEGFDLPAIEVGIFLRPTQSLTLWLQQQGRCLRAMPGKEYAFLFDHSNNALRHGLPDEEREWSLEGDGVKSKGQQKVPIRQCPQCYAVVPLSAKSCRWCNTVFVPKPREVDEVEGELEELTAEQMVAMQARRTARREQGMASTYEALLAIERQRGYRPGWARIVWESKQNKNREPYASSDRRLKRNADWYRPKGKT